MVMGKPKTQDEGDNGDDAGGVKGIGMKTHDGRMVDEPCTRKSFLENRWIQWLVTHVFWWMDTLLYGLQQCLCFAGTRRRLRMKKTKDFRRQKM
jgi:hypothetical protein